ncbi:MAG: hypothetical protein KC421_06525, partial [Anaerolineales bacterium]|nr:hypothetical protein [Anaerolineales bacterium]
MRPLKQALQDHELIVLRVIGEWWELDLTGADKNGTVTAVADTLERLNMVQERDYLPPEEAAAINDLVANGGRMPVATFERAHGAVRMMGPGKLEREEPWFDPASVAEALWYRGFLYRGFDETTEGVIEFYYLPDELAQQFPLVEPVPIVENITKTATALKPVPAPTQVETPALNVVETAVTNAVDDVTTLLAVAQLGNLHANRLDELNQLLRNPDPERRSLLINLARELEMLRETDAGIRPTRTAVSWLQQTRESQLRDLADAWTRCSWNDLCHTPGLQCEGENWQNDPVAARTALLDNLPRSSDWYRLPDLINTIKQTDPDFQRPDGNYETWYIRDLQTGKYVTGFENWEQVEGRLLAFMIRGPLAWLGMVQTADSPDRPLFQLTDRGRLWLQDEPLLADEVRVPLVMQPDGVLLAPHNADRYQRFQA